MKLSAQQNHLVITGNLSQEAVSTIERLVAREGVSLRRLELKQGREGLSATQTRVLEAIEAAGQPISTVELVEQLGIARNSLRVYLSQLHHQGFIRRLPGHFGPAYYEPQNEG